MATDEESFIPTRKSLLVRLKDWEDQESWRRFFDTYWRFIYNAALKAGLSETESQEVVQETVISVAKKMGDFQYDSNAGSFKGWLMQLTRWRITDQLRKRKPDAAAPNEPDDSRRTGLIERIPDEDKLEVVWNEEWNRNLIEAARERVIRQVPHKQYQVYDLYVLKDTPVSEVSKTLGVSTAQVYLAKHRVGKLMQKELELLQQQSDPTGSFGGGE